MSDLRTHAWQSEGWKSAGWLTYENATHRIRREQEPRHGFWFWAAYRKLPLITAGIRLGIHDDIDLARAQCDRDVLDHVNGAHGPEVSRGT